MTTTGSKDHYLIILLLAAVTLFATSALFADEAASFEALMAQFPKCEMPGAHLETNDGKPEHPFFRENNLTPYKIENDFAYYSLATSYFGIPVVELVIPASTWRVHVVTFDAPLEKVQKQLKQALGSDFQPSEQSERGERPELVVDPKNPSRSMFVCTSPM